MASAGMPRLAAFFTAAPTRQAPSSVEYSVWQCKWTNESGIMQIVAGSAGVNARWGGKAENAGRLHAAPARRYFWANFHAGWRLLKLYVYVLNGCDACQLRRDHHWCGPCRDHGGGPSRGEGAAGARPGEGKV